MFAFPSVDVFFGSSLACQRKHPKEARRQILAIPLSPQTPPASREGKAKLRKKTGVPGARWLPGRRWQRQGFRYPPPPPAPIHERGCASTPFVRTPLVVAGTWHWRWGFCEARWLRRAPSALVDFALAVPAAGALRSQRAADRRGQRAARPGGGRG